MKLYCYDHSDHNKYLGMMHVRPVGPAAEATHYDAKWRQFVRLAHKMKGNQDKIGKPVHEQLGPIVLDENDMVFTWMRDGDDVMFSRRSTKFTW